MTDLEMIRKCAEKMWYMVLNEANLSGIAALWCSKSDARNWDFFYYLPHHGNKAGDAQAMALVKRLHLNISCQTINDDTAWVWRCEDDSGRYWAVHAELNRAIVECVAKLP